MLLSGTILPGTWWYLDKTMYSELGKKEDAKMRRGDQSSLYYDPTRVRRRIFITEFTE